MNPSVVLALGLEGVSIVLTSAYVTLAFLDPRSRARALAYCVGLGCGATCVVHGPIVGTIATGVLLFLLARSTS